MATKLQDVYDVFLSKVEADEWMETEFLDIVKKDWKMLLDDAISRFRYPRVSLEYDAVTEEFVDELKNDEIQILASFMKLGWTERCIATWDNIRQLYSDKDWSQANFLDKINKTAIQVRDDCRYRLDRYDRAVNYKPNKIFSQLAGKKRNG